MTTAERDRKEGIAQGSATAYSNYSVAQADAQLVWTTTEADADLSWSQTMSATTHALSLAMTVANRDEIRIIHHGERECTETRKNCVRVKN